MMMMNGATETELLLNCTDMSVLERERAHHPGFGSTMAGFFSNSWTINGGEIDGFLAMTETDERLSSSPESKTTSVTFESGNFKKRKFDSVVTETKEVKSQLTEENNETTRSIMKMNNKTKNEQRNCSNNSSKVTKESQKTDYIHVRARGGQATDSHSIAERARREKISERMKYLQALVLGCQKITSKAGALDEIINYVLSLQRQVEFLSMKLAAVSPRLNLDIDDIFAKDILSAPIANLPSNVMPSYEMVNSVYPHEMVNSGYLHFNLMQQVVTSSNPPLPCFNNSQAPSMWESDVHNLNSSLRV